MIDRGLHMWRTIAVLAVVAGCETPEGWVLLDGSAQGPSFILEPGASSVSFEITADARLPNELPIRWDSALVAWYDAVFELDGVSATLWDCEGDHVYDEAWAPQASVRARDILEGCAPATACMRTACFTVQSTAGAMIPFHWGAAVRATSEIDDGDPGWVEIGFERL